MDGTAEELSRVNVLDQELNQNFKKQLSDKYLESLKATDGKVNLEMKKSVEKIAKDLNINIGSVPDDLNVKGIKRGVKSFEKLNIKDEILKSLKNQQGLSANFKAYVKNNPDVFKMANFKDTSKLGTNLTKVTDKHIEGVTKIFKNAGKNTLRGKMWTKMIKSGGWKMAGRGFLRFFGPWGLAAWAVSEIVIWRLDAIKAQQGENDALMQEMLDVDTEASAMDFIANTDMEKFKHLTQGPMMLADPNTKQKENVRMLLETVKKNKEAQEVYIQELMKHGWSEAELRQMQTSINTPRSQYGANLNSLHPAADKAAAARAFEESLAFAKEYTNAAYGPGLTMNDDILYGTGVGTYGGYTDLSRGGDIITVHNSETIFINQPKENVHHLAKGPNRK